MSRVSKLITNPSYIEELISIKEEDLTLSYMTELFGEFGGKARFNPYDYFQVPKESFGPENMKNKNIFTTTVGLWVFNKFFIEKELVPVLGYINYELNGKKFNATVDKLTEAVLEDKLDVLAIDTYLQKAQKIMPMSTILTPHQTEKFIKCLKEINKKKKQLATKYKDRLEAGDFIIAEQMEKELLDFALEYLKDDPSLDIYLSGARSSLGNHFKNMYIMKGAVRNPDPNAEKQFNIVLSNYSDGISKEDYPIIANSLAEGPYKRSNRTAIGGYWEKLAVSGYQHMRLDEYGSDCHTVDYIEVEMNEKEYHNWKYSYIIERDGKLVCLSPKNRESYYGKTVKLRFCGLCESRTGICNKCFGDLPYKLEKRNIGVVMPVIFSTLKNKSMKSFHDSTIKTHKIDPSKIFRWE